MALRLAALIVGLILASIADAGGTRAGSPGAAGTGGRDLAPHKTYLCIIGDSQKQINPKESVWLSEGQPGFIKDVNTCEATFGCVSSCPKSPYCKGSWLETTAQVSRNQTYSLIGRPDLIDWTGMTGFEAPPIAEKPNWLAPHSRCDLIIHVGDVIDTGDGGTNCTNPGFSRGLPIAEQWARWRDTQFDLIKASGIPFFVTQGNHDDGYCFERDVIPWFQAQPYHYASLVQGFNRNDGSAGTTIFPHISTSMAGLVNTPLGKLCVLVSGTFYNKGMLAGVPTDDLPDNVEAFYTTHVGCGGSHPTIVVSHYGGGIESSTHPGPGPAFSSVDSLVFLRVIGHAWADPSPLQSGTNLGVTDNVLLVECNWQPYGRVWNLPSAYGAGARDGAGGSYCIVELDPDNSRAIVRTWSPWSQTAGKTPGSADNLAYTEYPMNWVTRYGALP